MSSLCPYSYLRACLITEENALLLLTVLHTRDTACVAPCGVDSKGPVDVPPSLIKLNGLPGVLGRLTDRLTAFDHNLPVRLLGLVWTLHVLLVNVPLNLILAEAKGQIQFKCLVRILSTMWLLKARCVRIGGCSGATIRCAARILRPMVI